MESRPIGIWMEAKIVKLRRNRKKEIFDIPLLVRQDFSKKIGSDRRKWKKFLPPTHAVLRSRVGRLYSALERGVLGRPGAFFSFRELLRRNSNSEFPGNSIFPGRNLSSKKFSNFFFVLGFLDPRSNFSQPRNTKEFESVRVGTRKRRTMTKSRKFLIHQINRSSFVARKQRIFAIKN